MDKYSFVFLVHFGRSGLNMHYSHFIFETSSLQRLSAECLVCALNGEYAGGEILFLPPQTWKRQVISSDVVQSVLARE